jgi:hypothetical protein
MNNDGAEETDMIVNKAEEILKNISLFDLIKLSMYKGGESGQDGGKGGLRNLLRSSSKEIDSAIKQS